MPLRTHVAPGPRPARTTAEATKPAPHASLPVETTTFEPGFLRPRHHFIVGRFCGIPRGRLFAIALLAVVPAVLAARGATHESERTARHETWAHRVFRKPGAYAKTAAYAAIEQAKGDPYEWGGGMAGYTKRFGSVFAKHIVKSSIQYSVAKVRHEELDYTPSNLEGFRPRVAYALMSTVITRKTDTGRRTISTSEISAVVGSGLISRLWQPASLRTIGGGFGSAGISLGSDAGYNVVREFWPEIRHPRRHRNVCDQARSARRAALSQDCDLEIQSIKSRSVKAKPEAKFGK